MKPLSERKINFIRSLCNKNLLLHQIAKKYVVSHTIVAKIRKKYSIASTSIRNDRPRLVSDRDAREIARRIRSDDHKTPKIAGRKVGISASE